MLLLIRWEDKDHSFRYLFEHFLTIEFEGTLQMNNIPLLISYRLVQFQRLLVPSNFLARRFKLSTFLGDK